MNDVFYIAVLKIKKKLNVLSYSEKTELEKFQGKYSFINKVKIKNVIKGFDIYSKLDKDKAWESIENKIQEEKDKDVFIFYRKTMYKYAAVAAILVGVLMTIYYFKDIMFQNAVQVSPSIVNSNTVILPGTDKATLTLEDGSVVALEKGNSYHTQNAQSNGEEIVYKNKEGVDKDKFNYLTIPRGGQFLLNLSDGTKVWLNSETQLKFPVNFVEGKTRSVELVYGEAYFDVSPSSKHKGAGFTVLQKNQQIHVLGTEFNLKAYSDDSNIYTTLVEGKVEMQFNNSKQNLIPSQRADFDLKTNKVKIAKVDVYNEISWKDGVFSFEEKPLYEIIKVLSRWYDFEVVFQNQNIRNQKFNGSLIKDRGIDEIMVSIKNYGIINSYEFKNKTLILR
ncbi:iron dicitrate transporter FecR [Flavobacterium palustre]|uniref:Iron dicitrate transporter FecR n=1 Tax=Flavobacterium palustre TaxID=1476463 RepID=A0ABQ1HN73_9FLAO|nr:FecR family protein [Flavobacterium palustre]GGA82191.1 iron dicitrate transporter FecR [Flavobacterium palustre]